MSFECYVTTYYDLERSNNVFLLLFSSFFSLVIFLYFLSSIFFCEKC